MQCSESICSNNDFLGGAHFIRPGHSSFTKTHRTCPATVKIRFPSERTKKVSHYRYKQLSNNIDIMTDFKTNV